MYKYLSQKGEQWKEFSDRVLDHVENYAVPQYGDTGNDQIDEWPIESCQLAIQKYIKRSKSNMRAGQDKLDILKIAHFACLIYNKMEKEDEETIL